ncbi:transposase [Acidiphilium sp. AL]|nr:transposase [Acidiphilium sp. AL]
MMERIGPHGLEITGVRRDGRRRYDPASKERLIEACFRPGVSLAGVALQHGVNANPSPMPSCMRDYGPSPRSSTGCEVMRPSRLHGKDGLTLRIRPLRRMLEEQINHLDQRNPM